jgi:MinD-like ATPase involved in chromosome partitioning or flagellar assembly
VSIEEKTASTHPTPSPPAGFAVFSGASRAEKYLELNATQANAPSNNAAEVLPSSTDGPTATAERQWTDVTELRTARFFHTTTADSENSKRAATTAQHGVRGLLSRLGVRLAPSSSEAAMNAAAAKAVDDEVTIRQATWTRAVSILVANPKGGVGKTPTAILLGGTLAAIRGGSVCIMEVSDDPGALTYRAEGTPTLGIGELVRDVTTIRSAGQLAGYTAPQTSYASILGTVGTRPQLTGDDVTAVATVIDDYYAIRVMDSGNQPSSPAFHSAIDTADILVIPVFNAGDAALEAIALLDTLRNEGGHAADLADRAVLLRLTDGRPEKPRITARVDEIITASGIAEVFPIPYDDHIAERDQLTLAKLAHPTRVALTAAAAAVVRSLQSTVR